MVSVKHFILKRYTSTPEKERKGTEKPVEQCSSQSFLFKRKIIATVYLSERQNILYKIYTFALKGHAYRADKTSASEGASHLLRRALLRCQQEGKESTNYYAECFRKFLKGRPLRHE